MVSLELPANTNLSMCLSKYVSLSINDSNILLSLQLLTEYILNMEGNYFLNTPPNRPNISILIFCLPLQHRGEALRIPVRSSS